MFGEKTQKRASNIAFTHDEAPKLYVEYLRELERDQVVKDLMKALQKLERKHYMTVIPMTISNMALSPYGFVYHEENVIIRLFTTKDVRNIEDLQKAKGSLHLKIMEITADFERHAIITYYRTKLVGPKIENVITKSKTNKLGLCCCFSG